MHFINLKEMVKIKLHFFIVHNEKYLAHEYKHEELIISALFLFDKYLFIHEYINFENNCIIMEKTI